MKVYVTDYITRTEVEKKILGNYLSNTKNKKIEILLVWHQKIDKKYLSQFPNLKAVIRYGVGYDMIDLLELKKRKIAFCNVPDYGIDEVSDTALAMILSISRGINEYNNTCRNYLKNLNDNSDKNNITKSDNNWQHLTNPRIKRLSHLYVGIIGCGRIGSSLAKKLKLLNYNVGFYDPYLKSGYEKIFSLERHENLENLIKKSDIISIHVPLNNETKGMINKNFLKKLKKNTSIVNTSRGGILQNLNIIYDFLKENKNSNVALDVLPSEPPSNKHKLISDWINNEKWLNNRLIINSHTSYFSQQSFLEMRTKASLIALNIIKRKIYKNRII